MISTQFIRWDIGICIKPTGRPRLDFRWHLLGFCKLLTQMVRSLNRFWFVWLLITEFPVGCKKKHRFLLMLISLLVTILRVYRSPKVDKYSLPYSELGCRYSSHCPPVCVHVKIGLTTLLEPPLSVVFVIHLSREVWYSFIKTDITFLRFGIKLSFIKLNHMNTGERYFKSVKTLPCQ